MTSPSPLTPNDPTASWTEQTEELWVEKLAMAMDAEFAAWTSSLLWSNGAGLTISAGPPVREFNKRVYPHPTAEGGLPDGWDLTWLSERPASYAPAVAQPHQMGVVHRRAGGWALLLYRTKKRAGRTETNLWIRGYPTAANLYEGAMLANRAEVAVEEVRRFVISCYDLTDPVEEAEATLIGLGGPITVFPRALTEPTY
jgi:hypothetical protein